MASSLLLTILPEELVVEILIRLHDLADLARAASACKALRRLITSRAFLARLHALHAKPLLGLLQLERDRCRFLPAATATAAAVARASDFAFSFLPDHGAAAAWRLRDVRHGLALLSSPARGECGGRAFFPDVVVCDPLRRRHVRVPPIPDDLTAAVRRIAVEHFDYLLASAGRDGSSFRVVCRPKLPKQCDVTVFVFSSGSAFWRSAVLDACAATEKLFLPQSVHGYVYWRTHSSGRLLMLDTRDMDFFFVNIQPNNGLVPSQVIGEAEEVGRLAVFNIIFDVSGHKVELHSKAIRGGADEQWRHDRTVPLLPGYKWRIIKIAEGYLLLQGIEGHNSSWFIPGIQLQHFTLDLKTFKLERLCASTSRGQASRHHYRFQAYDNKLVVEILIRLDDLADLARAASACRTLRRLITSRAFLRRVHALHPRPLLGLLHLENHGCHCHFLPAEPPHPSAATAAAVARASGSDFAFSFSFLPGGPGGWRLRDVRHGLAVLSTRHAVTDGCFFFPDIVVCNPLRRRYVRIPPISDDLAAPIRNLGVGVKDFDYLVAPSGREGLSFRVICRPQLPMGCDVTVFVFNSGTVIWRTATLDACPATTQLVSPQYVHGYVYWRLTRSTSRLLLLDTRDMDFFFVHFKPMSVRWQAIGEAGEVGRLAVFNIAHTHHKVELLSKAIRGSADEQWRHDKTIPLLPGYKWRIVKLAEGYLLLEGRILGDGSSQFTSGDQLQYFTLDINTFKLERLCASTSQGINYHHQFELYRCFPPPLSFSRLEALGEPGQTATVKACSTQVK
uniref:F-box domain-containing protein n=1 Tax=Oryza punctata TaxID=4537 RepID=A0A0E0M5A7_ORYPU